MRLAPLDWAIVLFVLGIMLAGVFFSRRQIKSVADFLAAGRTAGRYLLSVAGGIAGLGAITIVGNLEMNYQAGFSMSWWGMNMSLVVMLVTVSGWVIYRFRQSRCLTLAEFFERRYSKPFRIFAGLIVFSAGLVNFGIFPAVGARFFITYCGLPEVFQLFGLAIDTFPLVMIALLSTSLFFVFTGGQIVVILTDFLQGLIVAVVFLVIVLYLMTVVGWDQMFTSLTAVPDKASLVNPFDTGNIPDFNFWFYLIGVIGFLYASMSWQGTQAYNVSAKSAHEAKMGAVLGMWRGMPQAVFLTLVPVIVFTVLHHVDFSALAGTVEGELAGVGWEMQDTPLGPQLVQNEAVVNQLRSPLALAHLLPVGLLGAFAAVMLAAFVSTHDTYLHSWASVFVQDVVLPFRKKPLSREAHLRLLRCSIVGVAIFIFIWSMTHRQSEAIFLYFAITGAIFAGGSGAVVIGGLYTRWGTAAGAWGALITGSTIAVGGIFIQKLTPDQLLWVLDLDLQTGNLLCWLRDLNGQVYWALAMGASALVYVALSLAGGVKRFDLDRLLRRGRHALEGESVVVTEQPSRGWRIFGMGREFSRRDKALYIATYIWTGIWTVVFIVGTIVNLSYDEKLPDESWMAFWKTYMLIQIVLAAVIVVWFTIGGLADIRRMFARLRAQDRNAGDDGQVRGEEEAR